MRLIDADALIISLAKDRAALVNNHVQHGEICRVDETIWKVVDAPTIDAVPVVHGEWISMGNCRCDCSVCGGSVLGRTDRTGWADSAFCGYCGAKMEKEEVCSSLQSQDDCQD